VDRQSHSQYHPGSEAEDAGVEGEAGPLWLPVVGAPPVGGLGAAVAVLSCVTAPLSPPLSSRMSTLRFSAVVGGPAASVCAGGAATGAGAVVDGGDTAALLSPVVSPGSVVVSEAEASVAGDAETAV
jgi:hypothetical protein